MDSPAKDIISTIALRGKTTPDIKLYIGHRLDSIPAVRDRSRPEISKWWMTIVDTLHDKAAGDYVKLVKCLDDIGNTDMVDDIKKVLDDAGKSRTDRIKAEIQSLNKSRTAREMAEINEIILWMHTAHAPLSLATLYSTGRRRGFFSSST